MLPGVYEEIRDGTSGVNPAAAGEGLVMFIGAASGGTATAGQPVLLGRRSAVRQIVGDGPLAERLEDYFGAGGQKTQAIAIPLAPTAAGVIGPVSPVGASTAACAAAGTPLCAVEAVVEVVTGGDFGTATLRLSVDGGLSWSPVVSAPSASGGTVELQYMTDKAKTGITLTFTDGAPSASSFIAGDRWTFDVSEPDVTASDVITPLTSALLIYDPEFVAIVGESAQSEWATFSLLADDQFNLHKPVIVCFEYPLPTAAQTIDQWVTAALADGALFAHKWSEVVAGYGRITRGSDGTQKLRNTMGVALGFSSRLRVNESRGRYLEYGITQVQLPDGYTDAHAQQLDEAGFSALMKHAGSKVLHFVNARLKSQPGSDFVYVEDARVMRKAIRICRIEALKSLQMPATDQQMEKLKADCINGGGIMKKAVPPEIHNLIVTIPAGQDIVNNGLVLDIQVVKFATLRVITLQLWQTFYNPTA